MLPMGRAAKNCVTGVDHPGRRPTYRRSLGIWLVTTLLLLVPQTGASGQQPSPSSPSTPAPNSKPQTPPGKPASGGSPSPQATPASQATPSPQPTPFLVPSSPVTPPAAAATPSPNASPAVVSLAGQPDENVTPLTLDEALRLAN